MTLRAAVTLGVAMLALPLAAQASAATASPKITEYTAGLEASSAPQGISWDVDGELWFALTSGEHPFASSTTGGTITAYTVEGTASPHQIAQGPEGDLWVTESGAFTGIGKLDPGTRDLYQYLLPPGSDPTGIAYDSDGNMWFLDAGTDRLGKIVPSSGEITELNIPAVASYPQEIVQGKEGALWFTLAGGSGAIEKFVPSTGVFTEYTSGLTASSQPTGIAKGADGAIWFTEDSSGGAIGRVNTETGAITQYTSGIDAGQPEQIAAGSNGDMYFTENKGTGGIGQVTSSGQITTFSEGLTPSDDPLGISPGPDGNIWFTLNGSTAAVGRLSLSPSVNFTSTVLDEPRSATVDAYISGNAQASTYIVEYGLSNAYGSQTAPQAASTNASALPSFATLEDLIPGETYDYRFVATNASGSTDGKSVSVTTDGGPTAVTGAAGSVGETEATLSGAVNPRENPTTYQFEYGTSTSYGSRAPAATASAGAGSSALSVTQTLTGLQPGTTYHYRLVASDCPACAAADGLGSDETFTTLPEPAVEETPSSKPVTSSTLPKTTPVLTSPPLEGAAAAPPPILGDVASVVPQSGTILVQNSAGAFQPLSAGAVIPVGTVVNATHGVLTLVTALPGGRTQSATVWGGTFAVGQHARGSGMTNLYLRGPLSCPRRRGAAAAASAHGPRKRLLWTKDNHGHYTTYGADSAATVMGTIWKTTDTCSGTITRVYRGRVMVRDHRRHEHRIVSQGHFWLARP